MALIPSPGAGRQLGSLGSLLGSLLPGNRSLICTPLPFPFIMRPRGETQLKISHPIFSGVMWRGHAPQPGYFFLAGRACQGDLGLEDEGEH